MRNAKAGREFVSTGLFPCILVSDRIAHASMLRWTRGLGDEPVYDPVRTSSTVDVRVHVVKTSAVGDPSRRSFE